MGAWQEYDHEATRGPMCEARVKQKLTEACDPLYALLGGWEIKLGTDVRVGQDTQIKARGNTPAKGCMAAPSCKSRYKRPTLQKAVYEVGAGSLFCTRTTWERRGAGSKAAALHHLAHPDNTDQQAVRDPRGGLQQLQAPRGA